MRPFDYYMKPFYHASHLYSERGFTLDLHHHLLNYNRSREVDAPFWRDSQPLAPEHGMAARVLSPTHQIFHNLVHGNFPHIEESPVRWVADCHVVYTQHEVDWDEVLRLAADTRLRWPVRQGLRTLTERFGLQLPAPVRAKLEALVPGEKEVAFRRFLQSTFEEPGSVRKYYRRSRHEYGLYFKEYTRQPFAAWFGRKTLARVRARLAGPTM